MRFSVSVDTTASRSLSIGARVQRFATAQTLRCHRSRLGNVFAGLHGMSRGYCEQRPIATALRLSGQTSTRIGLLTHDLPRLKIGPNRNPTVGIRAPWCFAGERRFGVGPEEKPPSMNPAPGVGHRGKNFDKLALEASQACEVGSGRAVELNVLAKWPLKTESHRAVEFRAIGGIIHFILAQIEFFHLDPVSTCTLHKLKVLLR